MLFIAFNTYGVDPNNPGFPDNYPANCYEVTAIDFATAQALYPSLHVMEAGAFNSYVAGIRLVSAAQIEQAQSTARTTPAAWYEFWK